MAKNSTVIGRTTFVRGRVSGDGDLEISGRVEGDVVCSGEVLIEATGLLASNVSGSRIVVRGAVRGDLVATESLVIDAGARVVGDLRAPRITIVQGGLVRGHVQTGAAGAARPRTATSAARSVEVPRASAPVARPAVKVVSPPPPVAVKTIAKPVAAPPAKHAGPPPPVVPVLKKGTKAVQKKRA